MSPVTLLYVENVISRRQRKVLQRLGFFVAVENLGYDKSVDILWAGEDGQWQTLAARFLAAGNDGREQWHASVAVTLSPRQALPGNIRFCIRYQVGGQEFWDNNGARDFHSEADSGVYLGTPSLQNLTSQQPLDKACGPLQVRVATGAFVTADRVFVEWTTDDWCSRQTTECDFQLDTWDQTHRSNARNPNQYGVSIWTGTLDTANAFRLQYRIGCQQGDTLTWEDNHGANYIAQRPPLRLMILNLHCYQEDNQAEKLKLIARAIDEQDVDIACLQEVAENWNDGHGDWNSNAVRIINEHLPRPFYIHNDWSHLGFDEYREGVAVLSRYPLTDHQSRYVSDSHDIYSIHSRKVVMAGIEVPCIGRINVYSAHLSWIEDGFSEQFERLDQWATDNHHDQVVATLLCGDFNVTVGSEGYQLVVQSKHYDDQFLLANQSGLFEKIFRKQDPYWQDLSNEEYRIDYVFMNRGGRLIITSADVIFTEHDYGPVSDHCGYLMTFEPQLTTADNKKIAENTEANNELRRTLRHTAER